MEGGSILQEGVEYAGISAQTIQSLATAIIDAVHPVGSIYLSIDDTNPANLFGGTWEQITDGKYLVASGSFTDGEQTVHTYTKDTSGGSYDYTCIGYANGNTNGHKLTEAQLPKLSASAYFRRTSGGGDCVFSASGKFSRATVSSSNTSYNQISSSTVTQRDQLNWSIGGDGTHSHGISNVPVSVDTVTEPRYYCVNVWKRTA